MPCLWCDVPCSEKLCKECSDVNNSPLFYCDKPRHEPTRGHECATCSHFKSINEEKRKRNAKAISELEDIRYDLINTWSKAWSGCDFGKTILGRSIDAALNELR